MPNNKRLQRLKDRVVDAARKVVKGVPYSEENAYAKFCQMEKELSLAVSELESYLYYSDGNHV